MWGRNPLGRCVSETHSSRYARHLTSPASVAWLPAVAPCNLENQTHQRGVHRPAAEAALSTPAGPSYARFSPLPTEHLEFALTVITSFSKVKKKDTRQGEGLLSKALCNGSTSSFLWQQSCWNSQGRPWKPAQPSCVCYSAEPPGRKGTSFSIIQCFRWRNCKCTLFL